MSVASGGVVASAGLVVLVLPEGVLLLEGGVSPQMNQHKQGQR